MSTHNRAVQNYPLITIKYPSNLFLCIKHDQNSAGSPTNDAQKVKPQRRPPPPPPSRGLPPLLPLDTDDEVRCQTTQRKKNDHGHINTTRALQIRNIIRPMKYNKKIK